MTNNTGIQDLVGKYDVISKLYKANTDTKFGPLIIENTKKDVRTL